MSERMHFVTRLSAGESMSELCREYGISRKTGYKIVARFETLGVLGLQDQSRRPLSSPYRTPEEVVERLVEARQAHPTWGPHKLRVVLERKHIGVKWPAESTIWKLFKDRGLVPGRKKRIRVPPYTQPLRHVTRPNQVWCTDYKGQFRLGNGKYCYPLTITDAYSRFLIACEALESTREEEAWPIWLDVFGRFGLPDAIRSDNGTPFASTSLCGFSRMSARWRQLGILHERIEPGHPEQNGRHERMHLTLKVDTTRPPGDNHLQQQDRFDRFVKEYDEERPHEALDDATPASRYTPSERPLPNPIPDPSYPFHDDTCRVSSAGHIYVPVARGQKEQVYLTVALEHQLVGLREIELGRWLVTFADLDLGVVELATRRVVPVPDVPDVDDGGEVETTATEREEGPA
jgi:putative transposase